jgi:hypothetical protein
MRRSPDRQAAKEERQQQKAAAQLARASAQAEAAFKASPVGQAQAARQAGRRFFQISLPIEETMRVPMLDTHSTARADATGLLEGIEAEGWTLIDTGYVFQETGSVSRDKLMSSGQTAQVAGRIVAIYLFRAAGGPVPETVDLKPESAIPSPPQ